MPWVPLPQLMASEPTGFVVVPRHVIERLGGDPGFETMSRQCGCDVHHLLLEGVLVSGQGLNCARAALGERLARLPETLREQERLNRRGAGLDPRIELQRRKLAWTPASVRLPPVSEWASDAEPPVDTRNDFSRTLLFLGDIESKGPFDVELIQDRPQMKGWHSALIGEETAPRPSWRGLKVWVRHHGRPRERDLASLEAILDEWARAASERSAPGQRIETFAKCRTSIAADAREVPPKEPEIQALNDEEAHLHAALAKSRSVERINEIAVRLRKLEERRAALLEELGGPRYEPIAPQPGVRCLIDCGDASEETFWALIAALATYSETIAPIQHCLIG